MQKNFHFTWLKDFLRCLAVGAAVMAMGLFIDWIIINIMLGCCGGGVCFPDIYPQCRNTEQGESYGKDN